ncbi:MAG: alpha/beta fold hydrolase [Hyphomicrobiales bacterium]|nr:alpha/beta fold hydrolase [Hyphomicrobiales bacterium]
MAGILLVHGGWHGPWCWNDFVNHLTESGHDVRAVQLRGHDQPPGRIWHRVFHYVEDVQRAVATFPAPPFLVGHSIGGLVVQKYLEIGCSPGAVLMASIPSRGTIAAVARLAVRHPIEFLKANLLLRLKPFIVTSKLVRELFFTPDTPQEIVDHCSACLQDESYLTFIDTMVVLPRPDRVQAPVLVLGAKRDSFFTVAEARSTARAYRTEAEIFPGMGHDMMLDADWRKVADRIGAWIQNTKPATPHYSSQQRFSVRSHGS